MAIIEIKDGKPQEAIQDLLRSMLEQGLVDAVLVPQEVASKKTVVQSLVKDPARLTSVNPLAPVFSVNSARIVVQMCKGSMGPPPAPAADEAQEQAEPVTVGVAAAEEGEEQAAAAEESTEQPEPAAEEQAAAEAEPPRMPLIAVVLKPCEIRALVELVKLQQATLEPFLVIGVDCWGTYSVDDYAAKVADGPEGGSVTADFLKQATAGNLPEELRNACRACRYPEPTYTDLAIRLFGEDITKQIRIQAFTEKGNQIFTALKLEETPESDQREGAVAKLKEAKEKLVDHDDLDFVETISSLCINCRNCRAVCPICYCKQCVFDGQVFEYPLEKYLSLSGKKGIMGMLPDKLLFHLTRMSHVATSCVACGQCEAACPSGIPLGRVYQRISAAAQEALDYEAGRSLDDELPLTTFREDELLAVEN